MIQNVSYHSPIVYEHALSRDPRWALAEGSKHFEEKSAVHQALQKIAGRLEHLQIPYAVAGGMALFRHGFRRFTEDVDVLVTKDGLARIHEALEGLGYVPVFTGSKNLRDTENGVRIEFLIAGQYPGDGRPKPVAFPEPQDVAERREGINYLQLPTLIELKLASGATNPQRIKDLADVQELIKLLDLPAEFQEQLAPFVRNKYLELWQVVHPPGTRYLRVWKLPEDAGEIRSLDDLAAQRPEDAELVASMKEDGVVLAPESDPKHGLIVLACTNPESARKYGMHEESEFRLPDAPGGPEG